MMSKILFLTILVAVQRTISSAKIITCANDEVVVGQTSFLVYGILPIILIDSLSNNPLRHPDVDKSIRDFFHDKRDVSHILVVPANTCPATEAYLCGEEPPRNYPLLFMVKKGRLLDIRPTDISPPNVRQKYNEANAFEQGRKKGTLFTTMIKNKFKRHVFKEIKKDDTSKKSGPNFERMGESSATPSRIPGVQSNTTYQTVAPCLVSPGNSRPLGQPIERSASLPGYPPMNSGSADLMGTGGGGGTTIDDPVTTGGGDWNQRTGSITPQPPSLDLSLSLGGWKESKSEAMYPQGGGVRIGTTSRLPAYTGLGSELQEQDFLTGFGSRGAEDRKYEGGSHLPTQDTRELYYLTSSSSSSKRPRRSSSGSSSGSSFGKRRTRQFL